MAESKTKSEATDAEDAHKDDQSALAAATEDIQAPRPQHRRVSAVKNPDGTYSFGVAAPAGSERYDAESGQLFTQIAVTKDELDEAIRNADKVDSAKVVDDGLVPFIHPEDQRADSSPRSQDRPPIRISSETSPMPANPEPSDEALAAGLPRTEEGIAAIPANVETTAQLNVAQPPEDVEKGKETGGPTPSEIKAKRDAEAARENPVVPSAHEVGVAAARAVRDGSVDRAEAPAPRRSRPSRAKTAAGKARAKAGSTK